MRKNRATLAGLLAALATLIVFGTAAQDEPHKIGFVDIQQAILSTAQGKAAVEEFNRKQREAQAKVQPEDVQLLVPHQLPQELRHHHLVLCRHRQLLHAPVDRCRRHTRAA